MRSELQNEDFNMFTMNQADHFESQSIDPLNNDTAAFNLTSSGKLFLEETNDGRDNHGRMDVIIDIERKILIEQHSMRYQEK